MNILTGLIVACGTGVLLCGWAVAGCAGWVRMARDVSCVAQRQAKRIVRSVTISPLFERDALGLCVFALRSGSEVKLDKYARGTGELLERIASKRSDLLPPG